MRWTLASAWQVHSYTNCKEANLTESCWASNKANVWWAQPIITWCIHFYHVACLPLGPEGLCLGSGKPFPWYTHMSTANFCLPDSSHATHSQTAMSDQFPFWWTQSFLKCIQIFHQNRLKSSLYKMWLYTGLPITCAQLSKGYFLSVLFMRSPHCCPPILTLTL